MIGRILSAACLAVLLAAPRPAAAVPKNGAVRAPALQDVLQAAFRHHRLQSSDLASLRKRAHTRGWLPLFATGYRYDEDDSEIRSQQDITNPSQTTGESSDRQHAVTVGALWDFRELVFNSAEVASYGVVAVQHELTRQVSEAYTQWKSLLIEKKFDRGADPKLSALRDLQIESWYARLNHLTGGWLAKRLRAAAGARS